MLSVPSLQIAPDDFPVIGIELVWVGDEIAKKNPPMKKNNIIPDTSRIMAYPAFC